MVGPTTPDQCGQNTDNTRMHKNKINYSLIGSLGMKLILPCSIAQPDAVYTLIAVCLLQPD